MQGQLFLELGALSDAELVSGLDRIVGSGRRLLAELLAHLCEVEDRRLHLDAGYPSLFAYCMARLGFTEDEAYRRINVARLARQAPVVFNRIAEGRLSLSVAALLQPYVLSPNLQQLIEAVAGKSVKDARAALVAFFPRPDVVASIRKVPRSKTEVAPLVTAPAQPSLLPEARLEPTDSHKEATHQTSPRPPAPASPAARPSSHTRPLSPGRFKIQFTADAALKDKLELARDLLRHAIPSGDLALIMHRALDLLVTDLQKRHFGTKHPRNTLPPPPAEPKAAKEKAANEMAARETAAKERAANEMAARETAARETAAREMAAREMAAREMAAREMAAREMAAREMAARETAAREMAARETAARETAARETAASETVSSETVSSETVSSETVASETAAREVVSRETVSSESPTAAGVPAAPSERAIRRAVCERDGYRCTWQGPDGVRCTSRAWLEQDHRIPRALGGTTTVQNLRLLCRAHNRRAAELVFGERHIEKSITLNQTHRRTTRSPPARS